MDKVARINSIDFHSAEAKAEFRKGFIEFQKHFPEIELIISVETSHESLMSIFVLPDQEAFDSAQKKREQLAGVFQEKFGHLIKERTVFDGDVGYWFQKIQSVKYPGASYR